MFGIDPNRLLLGRHKASADMYKEALRFAGDDWVRVAKMHDIDPSIITNHTRKLGNLS